MKGDPKAYRSWVHLLSLGQPVQWSASHAESACRGVPMAGSDATLGDQQGLAMC